MKKLKTAGLDEVPTEYLKMEGKMCSEWLVRIFNKYLIATRVLMVQRVTCIVPLYKEKNEQKDCEEK